jgi:hypothetical protein
MFSSIRKIIRESFNLAENLQQADKIYFKTGLMSPDDRENILSITGGDGWTRLVADWYYHVMKVWKSSDFNRDKKMIQEFYDDLKNYNKNVFPVEFDLQEYNAQENERGKHILDLFSQLRERRYAVNELRKLPAIALRNFKDLIRTPNKSRSEYYYKDLADKLRELNKFIELLPKPGRFDDEEVAARKEERRNIFMNKIFASKNTLEDMVKIAQQFAYAFNTNEGEEIEREQVIDNLQYIEAELVQDTGKVLVIKVNDQEAMEKLGCMSAWCFARPGAQSYWETYTDNLGYCYVIFDFSKDTFDSRFLMTYLPNGALYVSTNVPVEDIGEKDAEEYLQSIGVDTGALYNDKPNYNSSEFEDDEEEYEYEEPVQTQIRRQQQANPNQLSLFEIKMMVRELVLMEEKKSKFQKLKDNKVPLTDEERKKVMDADAVWHHGLNGAPSPAVWKSKDKKTGKVTYVTNTHRLYQTAKTVETAINKYHKYVKQTS